MLATSLFSYKLPQLQPTISKKIILAAKLTALALAVGLTGCATQHASQNYERPIYVNGVPSIYVVQSGDTLSHIATRYHLNYRKIAALNGLDSNYTIYTGQRLRLFPANGSQTTANAPANPTYSRPNYNANNKFPIIPSPVNNAPVYNPTPVTAPVVVGKNWLRPVNGAVVRSFGNGSNGVWYGAQAGVPVVASQAGTILYAGNQLTEYGNLIMIRHDSDYVSAYTHLGQINVQEGQQVQAGQSIGSVGITNGQPMAEFQIRYRGTPVNPASYVK